jgi:hypothetical protein
MKKIKNYQVVQHILHCAAILVLVLSIFSWGANKTAAQAQDRPAFPIFPYQPGNGGNQILGYSWPEGANLKPYIFSWGVDTASALSSPGFAVWPYKPGNDGSNQILGYFWPNGATMTLSIDNPTNGPGWDYTDTKVNSSERDCFNYHPCFPVDPATFVIKGGQTVRMTDGIHTIDYIVTNLRILWVDYDADTVSGTDDPGARIEVPACHSSVVARCAIRRVTADANGNWVADFGHPGNGPDEQLLFTIRPEKDFFIPEEAGENGSTKYWWSQVPSEIGGSLSGTVRDTDGNPIPNVQICAKPYDGSAGGRCGRTVVDGSYTIVYLAGGNYRVFTQENSDWENGKYYSDTYDENLATEVTVAVRETTTGIDFTLLPAGQISGTVHDNDGNPIADAWVNAREYDSDKGAGGAQTDADGSYIINGLPVGDYRVSASASGWASEYYNNTYDGNAAARVTVAVHQTTPDIDFSLELPGRISGTVYDNEGNPISGVQIRSSTFDSGYCGSGCTGETGADGSYVINDLPAGDYQVMVVASGWAYEIYKDTYGDNPTRVVVMTDETTTGIDFTLELGGRISGVVHDFNGNPIPNVGVVAKDSENGWGGMYTRTGEDGSYTIDSLPAGNSWWVAVTVEGWAHNFYQGANDQDTAKRVVVVAGETTSGIDFTLIPISQLTVEPTAVVTVKPTSVQTAEPTSVTPSKVSGNKNLTWLYVVSGLATTGVIVLAIVLILRRKK